MVDRVLCFTGTMMVIMAVGLSSPVPPRDQHQYSRGRDWLSRYGYLPPPDARTGRLQSREGLEKGIRQMQRFGGLKETGKLDEDTLALMATPRCSLPDIIGPDALLKKRRRRRKRYALSGLAWDKSEITWSVHGSPSTGPYRQTPELLNGILAHALKVWSDVTPLTFRQVPGTYGAGAGGGREGDIRVSFSRSFHEDGYPFDGEGGTLAHAFFPGTGDISGDTHFDDEEIWSHGGDQGSTDLFTVAVHEFGHALGLFHSSSDPSIMRPYYQGPVGDIAAYKLPTDDRLAIQTVYGVRNAVPGGAQTPRPPLLPSPDPPRPTRKPDHSVPAHCNGSFDAVANIRGEIFFFKGPHYWRIQQSGSLVSLQPALISNFWTGIPPRTTKVDAVYERNSDSHIVFFIGNRYWVFDGRTSLPGYPRPLSDWGMRSRDGREIQRVDAAFVWGHNGKTYLFSGGQFWRFDEGRGGTAKKLDGDYPKDATVWGGVPPDPDDIISGKRGNTYFFKGNSYWMLKQGGADQGAVASKSIAVDWLKCAPAPTPAHAPAKPRDQDCSCALSKAPASRGSDWLAPLAIIFIFFLSQMT